MHEKQVHDIDSSGDVHLSPSFMNQDRECTILIWTINHSYANPYLLSIPLLTCSLHALLDFTHKKIKTFSFTARTSNLDVKQSNLISLEHSLANKDEEEDISCTEFFDHYDCSGKSLKIYVDELCGGSSNVDELCTVSCDLNHTCILDMKHGDLTAGEELQPSTLDHIQPFSTWELKVVKVLDIVRPPPSVNWIQHQADSCPYPLLWLQHCVFLTMIRSVSTCAPWSCYCFFFVHLIELHTHIYPRSNRIHVFSLAICSSCVLMVEILALILQLRLSMGHHFTRYIHLDIGY